MSGKSLINIGLGGVLSKKSELRKSGIYTQQKLRCSWIKNYNEVSKYMFEIKKKHEPIFF